MKRGDRVRVKGTAAEQEYRGMTGTVREDCGPGEWVHLEFDVEAIEHDFLSADLELIDEVVPA